MSFHYPKRFAAFALFIDYFPSPSVQISIVSQTNFSGLLKPIAGRHSSLSATPPQFSSQSPGRAASRRWWSLSALCCLLCSYLFLAQNAGSSETLSISFFPSLAVFRFLLNSYGGLLFFFADRRRERCGMLARIFCVWSGKICPLRL